MTPRVVTIALLAGASAAAPAAYAQTTDWSGFHGGIGVGYAMHALDDGEVIVFDTNRDGTFGDTVLTSGGTNAFTAFCTGVAVGAAPQQGCTASDDDANIGFRLGYDWQVNNWVFGALAEHSFPNIDNAVTAFSTTPASYTIERHLDRQTALRARLGYAFGESLVYAAGGWAWADMTHRFKTTNTANTFTPSGGNNVEGYQVGAGYELKVSPHVSLGLEYLWTSLDKDDYEIAVGPGSAPPTNPFPIVDPTGTDMRRSTDKFEYHSVGVTLAWRP